MLPRRPLLFFLISSLCLGAHAVPLHVRIPSLHTSAREHAAYFPALLRLALDKSGAEYEIEEVSGLASSLRQNEELKRGRLSVIWDGSDARREAELLPVRISLLRQLNDYRLLLVRKEDLPRFAAIRDLDGLRQLRAGAGVNWPSTQVLQQNGLPVEAAISYESLFPMLEVKRFDYMPRGIYEVWYEQRVHADHGLVVEPSLVLHYHVPFYFFVSRDNPDLAARIERGLRQAERDGSFERLFRSVPAFARSLEELATDKRRILELKTP